MQLPALHRPQHHLCFFRLDSQFHLTLLTTLPADNILLPDAQLSLLSQLNETDRQQLAQLCAEQAPASIALSIQGRRWQCHLAPVENNHWLVSADIAQHQVQDTLGISEWQLQQAWAQASSPSLAACLPALMDLLMTEQKANRVVLWRHYGAEEILRPLYSQGLTFDLEPVKAQRRYLRTLQQRGGLSYSHCAHQPLLSAFTYLATDGIVHRLDIPLLIEQQLEGVISLEYVQARTPVTPSDMQFVAAIAERLAELITQTKPDNPQHSLAIDIAQFTPLLLRHTGQDFFNQLCMQLATLCQAEGVLVGLLSRQQQEVHVVACAMEGELQPPFSYHLSGTPCYRCLHQAQSILIYHHSVAESFPCDRMLTEHGMQGYIGLTITDQNKEPIGILALLFKQPLQDASQIQLLLEQLEHRMSAELLRRQDQEALKVAAVAFETQESLFITDHQMRIQQANHAFMQMSGYFSDTLLGRSALSLRIDNPEHASREAITHSLAQHQRWQGEQTLLRYNGESLPVNLRISQVKDKLGVIHHICALEDLSAHKAAHLRIETMAYFDELTGLHNRRYMVDHINLTVAQAESDATRGALLLLDLDDFKNINDSLGYAIGDQLLIQVAERLRLFIAHIEGASLARIASDEFVLIVSELGHGYTHAKTRAEQIAHGLLEQFSLPFEHDKLRLHLSASIGISLFPNAQLEHDEYLRQADTANHIAKQVAPGSHVFFSQEMADEIQDRLRISNDLQQALTNQEFSLHFQPQQRVSDNQTVGVEALLRWQPEGKSPISPGIFIPIAEETSLICDIGAWVLHTACAHFQRWQEASVAVDCLSVNISARQFHSPQFLTQLSQLLHQYPSCRHRLMLEVTEGVFLENLTDSRSRMAQIKALGVKISIDDFGTGYSSFAYLRELPADELKLDRSFVQYIDKRPQDKAIIACLLDLARTLNMDVVAEGIETEQQLATLNELKCPSYQGFLRARPMPEQELLLWLTQRDK
ncbi:putative bifunctional diguanylate cyclase/phosphodiesterase [Oceanisphaera pacifica]|uniref:EAL domain-containing protein n=1 Tax=Oceanisphaera pacifica TaxID=2818389 RepID=A0ABS3NEP2_9GAMM|nr:GGDEF domain-containing phosphodiesterase [Oceanisphaera pacifica]MBO1519053.1 EAL domain-containing protein [Oceanisphaera pacifica]